MTADRNHLARLLNETTPGIPLSAAELRDRFSISPQLAKHYVDQGLLRRLGAGIFCLSNDQISVYGALKFLQNHAVGLHVAGKTALAWQGISHNVYLRETTMIWGKSKAGLPKWVRDNYLTRYSSADIFAFENEQLDQLTRQPSPFRPLGVYCSCPERAILELLSEVGVKETWEEARNIFELVGTIRESVMGALLQACTSLKAKRLFVSWADDTGLLDVSDLLASFDISVGNANQWKITLSPGRKTSIKKVQPLAHGSDEKSRRNHPALIRSFPAGLKPKKVTQ